MRDTASARTLYRMALALEDGSPEFAPDSAASMRLLRQAADSALPEALNYLGFKYIKGEGIRQDVNRGVSLIERAAAAGDPRSYNNLGWLLASGRYLPQNYPAALAWFRRASECGVGAATAMLADMMAEGLGTPVDTLAADSLYHLALKRGVADADMKLLSLHRAGYDTLEPHEALRQGVEMYISSRPATGVYLARRAAAAGLPRGHALLGHAYSSALGLPYSHSLSMTHFYLAALGGDPSAQYIMAETLEMFPDALQEIDATLLPPGSALIDNPLEWYERAAALGVTDGERAIRRLLDPDAEP